MKQTLISKEPYRVLCLFVLTSVLVGVLLLPGTASAAIRGDTDSIGVTVIGAASKNITPDVVEGLVSAPLSAVFLIISTLASLFLGISGVVLNLAVDLLVVDMADIVRQIGAIDLAWTLIRDVINMVFIFVVLFFAINIILRIERFQPKRLIALTIVAAILINFSLFFSRVIIDASNVLTNEFYQPIAAASGAETGDKTDPRGFLRKSIGFSGAFVNSLQLSTIYDPNGLGFGDVFRFTTVIQLAAGSVFMFIAAFAFFAVAIMLIIRFVLFAFLMATSPVAFLGIMFPKGNQASSLWWKTLLDQAVWAPVFMLLATLSFIIISSPGFNNGPLSPDADFSKAFTGESTMLIVLNFIIVIGFLLGALLAAKNIAGSTASWGVNWATKLSGKAVFGTTGLAGRQLFGRAGGLLARSRRLNRLAKDGGATSRLLAAGLVRTGKQMYKGSYDARATGGLKGLQKATGFDMGKAKSGADIQKKDKDKSKRLEEYRKAGAGMPIGDERRTLKKKQRKLEKELGEAPRPKETTGVEEAEQKLEQTKQEEQDAKGFAKVAATDKRIAAEKDLAEAQEQAKRGEQEKQLQIIQDQLAGKRIADDVRKEFAASARGVSNPEKAQKIREAVKNLKDGESDQEMFGKLTDMLGGIEESERAYAQNFRRLIRLEKEENRIESARTRLQNERDLGSLSRPRRELAEKALKEKSSRDRIYEIVEKDIKNKQKETEGAEKTTSTSRDEDESDQQT